MADRKIGASGHEWQSCPKVRHPKKVLDSPDHPNDHGEHPYPFRLREADRQTVREAKFKGVRMTNSA